MAQRRVDRRRQPGAGAGDAARHRPDRSGSAAAAHRRRQHLDRDWSLQLSPARSGRAREGRDPRSRRHAARVQHRLDLRRHHHGQRGHEDLAREPRGDYRLDRAGRPRQPVRRAGRPGRLRQDHSRGGDGAGAPRHPRPRALRRVDCAGPLARSRRHHPGRVRGRRRARRWHAEHAGPRLARAPGLPGRRRLRRTIHRQHHGHRVRVPRHLAVRQRQRSGDRRRQGRRGARAPARW